MKSVVLYIIHDTCVSVQSHSRPKLTDLSPLYIHLDFLCIVELQNCSPCKLYPLKLFVRTYLVEKGQKYCVSQSEINNWFIILWNIVYIQQHRGQEISYICILNILSIVKYSFTEWQFTGHLLLHNMEKGKHKMQLLNRLAGTRAKTR